MGTGLFLNKVYEQGYPLRPNEMSASWTIQAQIQIRPRKDVPVKVALQLPKETPGYAIGDENFVARGFGVHVDDDAYSRTAQWAIRRAQGPQTLYYRATVYPQTESRFDLGRPRYPEPPDLEEPFATALNAVVEEVRAHSADTLSFTAEVLREINDPTPDSSVALLTKQAQTEQAKLRLAQDILAGARIPTKAWHGVRLGEDRRLADRSMWLAVYNGERWTLFDPTSGDDGLPPDVLLWWSDDKELTSLEGARLDEVILSIQRHPVTALELAQMRAASQNSWMSVFSLLDLPVQTQAVYGVLLMVPVGALVIAFLRNMIGIRTFGTFMPVLIALAFRETELLAGVVLFVIITALGLALRFYLEHLRLLLVPRLAAVLTIVVILMAIISTISHNIGIEVGLSVALFPMVILAMVIERMSIIWEERGAAESLIEGAGSLLVAALAYVVMGIDYLNYLVFVFPELLLILLGVLVAMGRYTGYRLSELIRFRELGQMSSKPNAS